MPAISPLAKQQKQRASYIRQRNKRLFTPVEESLVSSLRSISPFYDLPDRELISLLSHSESRILPKGKKIGIQNVTELKEVYLIRSGCVSLFRESRTIREPIGYLFADMIFGLPSLLINNGISLRTAIVEEESEILIMPKYLFIDLCRRFRTFASKAVSLLYGNHIDTDLDSTLTAGMIKYYLSIIAPFSVLNEKGLNLAEKHLSLVHYPKGIRLFESIQDRLGYLYILHSGSAVTSARKAKTTLENDGSRVLREGDIFGGSDLLLRNGKPENMLTVTKDAYFYLLPGNVFVRLCEMYTVFKHYFSR